MSDYTPTTRRVRDEYVAPSKSPREWADRCAAFDRWLAAHDVEVYQRGREDAAQAVLVHMHDMEGRVHVCCCPNVPRIAAGLPIAAARGDGEHKN